MEILTPVLKQIEVRPPIFRQQTIKEFFRPHPITDEEQVAKIRSKRMEQVIQQMRNKQRAELSNEPLSSQLPKKKSLRKSGKKDQVMEKVRCRRRERTKVGISSPANPQKDR